tara:strand:- start:425 stop:1273 length:849 start_codon:yes stop_codon:yes gene_type:complete
MNNILWSKGLEDKSEYQLAHTAHQSSMYEIIRELNNCKNHIIWIRNNAIDLDGIALLIDKVENPKKIVITDGDMSTGDYKIQTIKTLVDSDKITKMYFQNYNPIDPLLEHPKISYFPIGLDLHTEETKIGNNPYCKYELLLKMRNIPKTINKALIDFKATPRSDFRLSILKEAQNNDNITILNERMKICELYKYYSKYKFIICAEGGGLDTHRHYEAWLAGCCVLTHLTPLENMYDEFATIYIDDFSTITEQDLDEYWTATSDKRTTENVIPKFKYSYWYNK